MPAEAEILDAPMDDQQVDIPPQGEPTPDPNKQNRDAIIVQLYKKGASKQEIQAVVNHFKTLSVVKPIAQPSSSGITPSATKDPNYLGLVGIPSIEEAAARTQERHSNELKTASENIDKSMADAHSATATYIKDQEKQGDKDKFKNYNAYMSGNYVPEADPNFNVEPSPELVQQVISDPANHPGIIETKAKELQSAGKKKDADNLRASAYLLQSAQRNGNRDKQLTNANLIKEGKVEYNAANGELVKPENFPESFHTSIQKRNEDMDLFDLADNGSKEQLISKLNQITGSQDPDEPTPVPSGWGHIGDFIGGQGKVMMEVGAAQALNYIPVVGTKAAEAISGGLYAHEMARRGYSNELKRSYAEFKQAGLSDNEAVDKAQEQAKRAMIVDAGVAGLMGSTTAKSGSKLIKPVAAEEVAKVANPGSWYNGVVKKAYEFAKQEAPAGIKNASLASGGEYAKNISANRDESEGVLEAGANMAALHYTMASAFAIMGKGVQKGPVTLYNKLKQGLSKLPIEDIKLIAQEQIKDHLITPQEAAANIEAIEAHKELDALIPKSVKNDEVRLQLQDIVKKREATAEEKSNVSAAFSEPLKLKIEKYDEKINEIVNSPEAKEESPAQPPEKPRVTVSTPNIVNVKLKENAIPEQSANAMDVQPETRNGETVGGGDIQPKEVAGTQSEPIIGNQESTQPQGVGDQEKLDPYGLPFENEPQDKRSGIKNAISDAIRFERQLPKVDLPKMGKDVEVLAEGKRLVDSGEINPWEVVDRVLDKKEGMQPNEAKAMQYYMHQLDAHEVGLRSKISEAETPVAKAELGGRLQQLSDEMDAATEANIISGRAWSDVGNIRQIVTDQSFNPSRERAFIKDAYGGEIPEHVKVKLDAITKERDAAIAAKIKVEEQLRQKMAVQGFEKIKEQAKKTAKKAETKELLKKEEQDLLDELRKAFKKDIGNINAGIPIPVETIEVLGKLAINYVKQGINGLDSLVDKIHAGIPEDSGISKKQLRDILIDYDPLTATTEAKRINKKADLLEEKMIPYADPSDLTKPSRIVKTFRNNNEWVKAQQRVANAEHRIKVEKRKAFESKKNMYQKGLAWAGRLTRLSILSGYNVLGKLASAATVGSALKRIPEQAIGVVYQTAFKGIGRKAPIEAGINISAELKFYKEFFDPIKFGRNAWEILKTGSSDLGKRLGGAEYEHVPGLYLPTDLHQIIKDPPKRATFEASFKNGLNWAEKNGLDINDVLVINSLENAAYKRAQYEIFQEQNWLSRKFTSWKSKMEKSGNVGATGKFLADFMIPVSTVPTNIVRRVVTTSPIGLIRGSAEVVQAYRNGIEKLTPEQADHVMMQLKQGTLGTALWLIGWYGAGQFGGLYSKFNPDKQRKEGALKHDEMSVGGKMIPKPTQHALPLEIIQFAATARHVYDNYKDNKHESTPQALYSAGMGSIGALVEQIPVVETAAHVVGAFGNPYEAEKLKDDVKRRFEPQILRETGIIKKKEKPPPAPKATKDSRERKVNSRERTRK